MPKAFSNIAGFCKYQIPISLFDVSTIDNYLIVFEYRLDVQLVITAVSKNDKTEIWHFMDSKRTQHL